MIEKIVGIKNAACIADAHIGGQEGLCSFDARLDNGGIVKQSNVQKHSWGCFRSAMDEYLPLYTKNEPYVLISNGDMLDGRHHNATNMVSANLADQIKIAYDILAPEVKKAAKYYHIRGTDAHSGINGETEEILAKSLGAIPDEAGRYARFELWLEMGGELIHYSHHIGTTQSMAYESSALMREMVAFWAECARWGQRAPSAIVRSHRHRHMKIEVTGASGLNLIVVTPGFQAKSPYLYRTTSGRVAQPQVGISVLRVGDEDKLYERHKVWTLKREKIEKV